MYMKMTPTSSILILLLFSTITATSASQPPPISAVYAFGDSTVDPGNNNLLLTLFRADHTPYGVSFPAHLPTGRFSDGLISTDFLVQSLAIKQLLPPYLAVRSFPSEILTGVSFASGGSGLDPKTTNRTLALDMDEQVSLFREARAAMVVAVGKLNATAVVEKAVFLVSVGTNDWVWGFMDSVFGTPGVTTVGYSDQLVDQLERHVRELYNLGARRFAVVGIPPIGCLPIQATLGSLNPFQGHFLERLCSTDKNRIAATYNSRLKRLLYVLQHAPDLPGAKLIYMDAYGALMALIRDPEKHGFQKTVNGCCGSGMLEAGELCNLLDPICPNPAEYIFWDSFHPTQAANALLARQFMKDVQSLF